MRTIEIDLDQFQPWPEICVYVYGKATISYEYEPDDPDVGYRGGVTYPTVESITIEAHLSKDTAQTIGPDHPMFAPIAKILETTDYAVEDCENDWADYNAHDYEN